MKEGIHPNYYQAKVVCNCGNEFVTGSTKKDIHVEICSKCHSFYTGQQKAASARGQIRFDKAGLSFWIFLKTQPFLFTRRPGGVGTLPAGPGGRRAGDARLRDLIDMEV